MEDCGLPSDSVASGVGAIRLPSKAARALELSCALLNLKPEERRGWYVGRARETLSDGLEDLGSRSVPIC